jgi:tetratricopeptide (TPR) repeat protein
METTTGISVPVKKSSKKIIVIVIVAVVALAVIIFLVWEVLALSKKNSAATQPVVQSKTEGQTTATTQDENIYQTQNYQKAITDIEKKKKANQATVDNLITLGISYYNLEKYDQAISSYNDALKLDPQNSRIYGNIGNVYRDKGDYKTAEENYRKAISVDPTNISLYSNLAVMFIALENNKAAAIQILNDGLAKNPGNTILTNLLAEYQKM